MYQSLTYEVRDCVAYVTFTTPERLNSVSESRLSDLDVVLKKLEEDETLVAVSFTGTGRAFCVGLDKDLLTKAFDDMAYFIDVIRRYNDILHRVEELSIPTIAVVNGYARAGGIELVLACDLLLISNDAKIGDVHTSAGVMPGGGSTQRLPRRIGEQKAKELIWSARWLSGEEAVAYGLALKSVPHEELYVALEDMLADLRDKPRAVLEVVKTTMNEGRDLPIREAVNIEIQSFERYMGDLPYGREGFAASMEGRRPSWLKG